MIEAVEVVRDKEGGYTHPEWEKFSLSLDDMDIIPGYLLALFEKAHSCRVAVVNWEDTVDENCAAWMEYNEVGGGFASWSLAPPNDDAVLLSVHDTEDGPVQLWALLFGQHAYDLVAHLERQISFSLKAFGPGPRVEGISDHIKKELVEVAAAPEDLSEWIDIALLAFDGAWRAGHGSIAISQAFSDKLAKNEARQWPDWRTADPTKAIEHNREIESNA